MILLEVPLLRRERLGVGEREAAAPSSATHAATAPTRDVERAVRTSRRRELRERGRDACPATPPRAAAASTMARMITRGRDEHVRRRTARGAKPAPGAYRTRYVPGAGSARIANAPAAIDRGRRDARPGRAVETLELDGGTGDGRAHGSAERRRRRSRRARPARPRRCTGRTARRRRRAGTTSSPRGVTATEKTPVGVGRDAPRPSARHPPASSPRA